MRTLVILAFTAFLIHFGYLGVGVAILLAIGLLLS